MIKGALEIAAITRLCAKSFNITGTERLGIAAVEDPESPYHGRIPIPPLLDAQLDHLWIAKMKKIKKKVLSELKSKIMSRKREHWYSIFLTTLILVTNLEFLYQNQNRQLERYCQHVKTHSRQNFADWLLRVDHRTWGNRIPLKACQ